MSEVKTSLEKLGKKITDKDCTAPSISRVIDNIVKNYPEGGMVVVNPELEGNEEILTSIESKGVKYKVASGNGSTSAKVHSVLPFIKIVLREWLPTDIDLSGFSDFQVGRYMWTDGENIYFSCTWITDPTTGNSRMAHLVLDKETYTWKEKIWNGLTNFYGDKVWTDGSNIYCSPRTDDNYILDKATSTWNPITLTGMEAIEYFSTYNIWTDGENIYHSSRFSATHYIFDKVTKTWTEKVWSGLTVFDGGNIWTDGKNIYYSNNTEQYKLNKDTDTWEVMTWTGLTDYLGGQIWTDGEKIFAQRWQQRNKSWEYVEPGVWKEKTWNFYPNSLCMWWDGSNLYAYDDNLRVYVYNKTTVGRS